MMARTKGQVGERELFSRLSDELGIVVQRKLGAARDGGCDGLDVPGWAIEVKRTETLTLNAFWSQATRQALAAGRKPALFHRSNRRQWTAYVDPADFAPDLFGPTGQPIAMSLPRWCELARSMLAA
ncbi:MAG: hypothetical protein KBE22_00130 [Candidatus Accumulibacter sp.]|nr:hypothetical protein [Accumulibacter sp.]